MEPGNNMQKMTLEDIRERKVALKEKIKEQNDTITKISRELFTPVEPSTKAEALMNAVNAGISIFDGALFGMKAIRRIRSVVRSFKK